MIKPRAINCLIVICSFAVFASACAEVSVPEFPDVPIPETCNGSIDLCSRNITDVAFATTHNSMSSRNAEWEEYVGWQLPNQILTIEEQLDSGIRALMLDTHTEDGVAMLCHGLCGLGKRDLVDGLVAIRKFLETNRGEVLVFLLEDKITEAQTKTAFENSKLLPLVYEYDGTEFPTLGQMTQDNKRLMVMSQNSGAKTGWNLRMFDFVWDTKWAHTNADELVSDCEPNRGEPSHPFFLMNHWIGDVPEEPAATIAGNLDLMTRRVEKCAMVQFPNFVAVDYSSKSAVIEVVNTLNSNN